MYDRRMQVLRATSADDFLAQSLACVCSVIEKASGPVSIGLSGGSTPVALYKSLAEDATLPWDRLTFFLVDDRFIAPNHKDSNQFLIRSTLLSKHQASFIVPDTSLPVDQCIADYNHKLSSITPDLVILGMGDDGHIASLFPPLPPAAFGPTNVIHTTTERFAVHDRISTTLPFLERAKHRLFLISGEKKVALFRLQEYENHDPSMFPAHALFDERTTWIMNSEK